MSRRPVGYYVHHQGAGHWQRACLIARALNRPMTLIGTLSDLDTRAAPGSILALPDDRVGAGFDGQDGSAERPQGLHYAPLGADNVRARMGRLAAWIVEADPALIVVDVSVEIALFARLMSVPTLVVRLAGTRTDLPHLEAFRSAERLLAFFPPEIDSAATPTWVRAKTSYAGLLTADVVADTSPETDGSILVIYGRGGAGGRMSDLAAAAISVPDRHWHVLGPVDASGIVAPDNLHVHGWVADPAPHIARAELVIGGGGDGVVSAVAAAGKRFVCLPEPRAFDEQVEKSRALAAMGAAIHHESWPEPGAWPGIIAAALRLDPAVIGGLAKPGVIARTSALIAEEADRAEARRR
ncbi:glycosyltransferase [Methylobacterium sp. Leaf104]|uniref:glycosyl transferase n=1 Tax=Methylobacterium TaxID=407 RepID=UPI0006F432DC|nr:MULTISPECIES: glycosyl transferase [Methylobacterium]KQP31068.1 glycosyltransferase [Methylobacterium sp. Leaf104]MCI9881151.1 glycosyltransferase [Methylobacterium goesingense]